MSLERCQPIELAEDDLTKCITLTVDDHPHAITIRLVTDIGDAFDALVTYKIRDLSTSCALFT